MIERGENVDYDGVTIKPELDIKKITLKEDEDGKLIVASLIKIINSNINGIVNLEDAIFKKSINFYGSKFDHVSFQGAKFCKDAVFESTVFCGNGQFSHVHFMGDANFTNVQFIESSDARFCETKFKGDAFFWSNDDGKTTFSGEACFEFAEFCNHVTFHQATFCEKADFQLARFRGEWTLFMGALFKGGADFSGARFGGDADFRWVKFNNNIDLTRAKINNFEVEWDSIKYLLDCDGTVYLALVKSFRNLERFDDADNCYYQYRRMSQNEKPWYEKKKKWLHRINWSKLYDHVAWRSCGYGVRPSFTLAWIFGSILGFASLYRIFDGITKSSPPEITMNALNNSTLLFTFASSEISPSFWECLYFSAVSLAGGTPVGLTPVGVWKYAVMFENVLGYLFLALFVVVLARKLIR
jgi:uncharacterized protein YjbI with pentapeptide repeats